MKVFVKAKTGAKEESIKSAISPQPVLWSTDIHDSAKGDSKKDLEKIELTISVKELPIKGKANMAIIKALAKHFKVSPSRVTLLSGFSSKQKVFEIL